MGRGKDWFREFPFCLTAKAVRFGLDDVAVAETSDSW